MNISSNKLVSKLVSKFCFFKFNVHRYSPGAHSFDGTYHIYRVMEKATGGRLSLEPNPARGPKPRPLDLEQVLRDLEERGEINNNNIQNNNQNAAAGAGDGSVAGAGSGAVAVAGADVGGGNTGVDEVGGVGEEGAGGVDDGGGEGGVVEDVDVGAMMLP